MIVVAATGFNHYEAEQMTIASVSTDRKTLTLTAPFIYRHFAGI